MADHAFPRLPGLQYGQTIETLLRRTNAHPIAAAARTAEPVREGPVVDQPTARLVAP